MSAKVFAVIAGASIEVGHYGTATVDVPCVVPDDVADQLEQEIRGLPAVARDESNPVELPGWPARPGRTDLRVEREAVPVVVRAAPRPAAVAAPPRVDTVEGEKK